MLSTVNKKEVIFVRPTRSVTEIVMFFVPLVRGKEAMFRVHVVLVIACPVGEHVRFSLLALYVRNIVGESVVESAKETFKDVFPCPLMFIPLPFKSLIVKVMVGVTLEVLNPLKISAVWTTSGINVSIVNVLFDVNVLTPEALGSL